MKEQPHSESIVFVIDHDASARAALKELFESVGLKVNLLTSGSAFLEAHIPDTSCCLVLDVRLPGMSGLKLQEELVRVEVHIPIIFLTAHGDIHMAVGAMKAGAVDFLTKPFRNQDVLDAVYAALEQDGTRRKKELSSSTIRERFESLSPRERDVVTRVAAGVLNKQIAAELGLSEVTVKVHRAKAMRKMHAKSLAELVRMTDFAHSE
jgi:FixJ family two-component response regulator